MFARGRVPKSRNLLYRLLGKDSMNVPVGRAPLLCLDHVALVARAPVTLFTSIMCSGATS